MNDSDESGHCTVYTTQTESAALQMHSSIAYITDCKKRRNKNKTKSDMKR